MSGTNLCRVQSIAWTIVSAQEIGGSVITSTSEWQWAFNIAQERPSIMEKCGLDESIIKWVSKRTEYTMEEILDNS